MSKEKDTTPRLPSRRPTYQEQAAREIPEIPEQYVSISKAAKYLGVSRQAICDTLDAGRIPAHHINIGDDRPRRVIMTTDLLAWARRRAGPLAEEPAPYRRRQKKAS